MNTKKIEKTKHMLLSESPEIVNKREIRPGTLIEPRMRIDEDRVRMLHQASLDILADPGITCHNDHAAEIYGNAGCHVRKESNHRTIWNIRFPEEVIARMLDTVPAEVILGARNPDNALRLHAEEPRVYFGTGSETNHILQSEETTYVQKDDPATEIRGVTFHKERGSLQHLCRSAKLCNALENVDFFIRNVNIRDDDITPKTKDVNMFMAALMYMTKHVQAGLEDPESLETVIRLAEEIAGGAGALRRNPIISFITCVIKSPLQMVDDTTQKLIRIAESGLPVVISSSPQGGSTAPIQEEGIVALINAELLAGIALTQLVNPGTPVLYGAVPVRARQDTLHDFYGAPEFIHYNIDCIQMARYYGIPCYSSAGVGDAMTPGIQATVEKLFAQAEVAAAGAQYIHYAVGLLEKTNTFSPLQAVLDDAHIGTIREILRQPIFEQADVENAVRDIRRTVDSPTTLFARSIRKARRKGLVSSPYPFETDAMEDQVLIKAQERLEDIMAQPGQKMDPGVADRLFTGFPDLLPRERFEIRYRTDAK